MPNTPDAAWAEQQVNDHFWALRRREAPFQAGRWLGLSLPRRLVGDLLHFARQIPTVPVQRRMNLGTLVAARHALSERPSWTVLFTKALGLVSARWPELRRSFLSFPWDHLYEHSYTIASVAVERQYQGENAVFFGLIPTPDQLSLAELGALLHFYKTAPVERVPRFRMMLLLSRLPQAVRRFVWWFGLNVRGLYRASFYGTFAVSVVAALGAASLHPLSPLTTTLNYGTFDAEGALDVRLTYDHRVLDGANVARILADLEAALLGPILAEVRALKATAESPPRAA